MEHARRDQLEPYVTRDGSTIGDWAEPAYAAEAGNLSLEDTVLLEGEG